MDEQTKQAVQQRAMASAMLSMAADLKNLALLKATALEFQNEPDLEYIYEGVRRTSPIVLPALEMLLDPLYNPDSE